MKTYKTIGTRKFYELQPGDIFKAAIHDIRPGEITIRFEGGEMYTARSMILPEARIGEDSLFSVRENDFEGRIVLEMIKSDPETKMTNMLNSALSNAGLASTPEMLALARSLLNAGLPVDTPTLHKAALLVNSENTLEQVIILLQKNLPPTAKVIPTPERFAFDMRV